MIAVLTYPGKKTSYPCLHAVQSAVEKVLLFPVVFNLDASFRRDAFDEQIFLRSANWMCLFPQAWPANEISCVSDAQTFTQCGITWGFKGACELHENLSPTLFAVKAHSLHYPTA